MEKKSRKIVIIYKTFFNFEKSKQKCSQYDICRTSRHAGASPPVLSGD